MRLANQFRRSYHSWLCRASSTQTLKPAQVMFVCHTSSQPQEAYYVTFWVCSAYCPIESWVNRLLYYYLFYPFFH